MKAAGSVAGPVPSPEEIKLHQSRNEFVQRIEKIRSHVQQLHGEMQELSGTRQRLMTQLSENIMTKQELELFGEDERIWKLIGPALVRQDKVEALDTVNKRLEYIQREIGKIEKELEAKNKIVDERKQAALAIQQEAQRVTQQLIQAQNQQKQ